VLEGKKVIGIISIGDLLKIRLRTSARTKPGDCQCMRRVGKTSLDQTLPERRVWHSRLTKIWRGWLIRRISTLIHRKDARAEARSLLERGVSLIAPRQKSLLTERPPPGFRKCVQVVREWAEWPTKLIQIKSAHLGAE
jgi:hypothetical protein